MNEQTFESSPPKKNHISLIIFIVIGFILITGSFLIGYTVGKNNPTLGGSLGKTSSCSDEDVIKRMIDAGYLPPDADPANPVTYAGGIIKKVGNDYVEFEASLTPFDAPAIYRAKISDATEIKLTSEKDPVVIQEEMEAFDLAMQNYDSEAGTELPEPPDMFIEKTISLSDITVGMSVNIIADNDIRSNPEFVAKAISVGLVDLIDVNVAPLPPAPAPDMPEPAPDDMDLMPPTDEDLIPPPEEDAPLEPVEDLTPPPVE